MASISCGGAVRRPRVEPAKRAFCRAMCPGPYGPWTSAGQGPKSPTHGVSTAAARCSGPVSELMNNFARRASAANSGSVVGGASSHRPVAGDDLVPDFLLRLPRPQHQRRQTPSRSQMGGHGGEAGGGPELGRPAGPRVDHGKVPLETGGGNHLRGTLPAFRTLRHEESRRRRQNAERRNSCKLRSTMCGPGVSTVSVFSQRLSSRPQGWPKPIRRGAPESHARMAAFVNPWPSMATSNRSRCKKRRSRHTPAGDLSQPRGSEIS